MRQFVRVCVCVCLYVCAKIELERRGRKSASLVVVVELKVYSKVMKAKDSRVFAVVRSF